MTRDPLDALRRIDPAARAEVHGPPAGTADRIVSGENRRHPVPAAARPGWMVAAATALVVVIAGAGWMLWLGPETGTPGTTTPLATVPPTTGLISPETTTPGAVAASDEAVYFLVADRRLDPPWEAALIPATRSVGGDDPMAALVAALLAGPDAAEAAADPPLTTAIPPGTRMLTLAIEDGVATLDLSGEFGTTLRADRAIAQVVFTLTRLDGIDAVHLLVDGTPAAALPIGDSLLDDPATRITYEGYAPVVLIESPAFGGTLAGGDTVVGLGNVFAWQVGLELSTADGTVLWETTVTAECLPGCRGEYDWAAFALEVPVPVTVEQAGVLTAYGFTEEGDRVDPRSHPVWLIPGREVTLSPTTTTTLPPDPDPVGPVALGPSPAEMAPLPADAVPEELGRAWGAAANRDWCAPVFPESIGDVEARVHDVDWMTDGWAVVWDLPSGPGRPDAGEYCPACGRGAFGVAGAGFAAAPGGIDRWPALAEWDDGSRAGYGYEGDLSPEEGMPMLASVRLVGQGCSYQVWSFLGEPHLLTLLDTLRFVEGMEAAEVLPLGYVEAAPLAMGPAPWTASPADAEEVDPLVQELWEASTWHPEACPLLAPTDLGTGPAGTARSTNSSEYAIAWDFDAGPGRGDGVDYCADCGRSAFGSFLVLSAADDLSMDRFPVTHAWDDGSFAWIMPMGTLYTGGIPDEFLEYRDGVTGEILASRPVIAYLQPDGYGCGYQFWSFLGADHLLDLLTGLRRVSGT